ncbi:MAG: metallophosphoesterase family protein [Candidatus Promineifilaceae bacterium]
MRLLILSDIHANLAAFEAVLADCQGAWDQVWCLGDLVGYGAEPNECIALLREQPHLCLAGNHDWAALGRLDLGAFNSDALDSVVWTREQLTAECRDYLEARPPRLDLDGFTLAHASPRHPIWEYVLDLDTAAENFGHFEAPYCFIGHSHVPLIFLENAKEGALYQPAEFGARFLLDDTRLLINPGSVGQPRDHDPRAAYGLLDTDGLVWEHRRVEYPVQLSQERIRAAGLPERNAYRLAVGW